MQSSIINTDIFHKRQTLGKYNNLNQIKAFLYNTYYIK